MCFLFSFIKHLRLTLFLRQGRVARAERSLKARCPPRACRLLRFRRISASPHMLFNHLVTHLYCIAIVLRTATYVKYGDGYCLELGALPEAIRRGSARSRLCDNTDVPGGTNRPTSARILTWPRPHQDSTRRTFDTTATRAARTSDSVVRCWSRVAICAG
jgi:hypothetical protein